MTETAGNNIVEVGPLTDNYEPRHLYTLVLDVSASMEGNPIKELNEGLTLFKEEIEKDELARMRLELCIVTFSDDTKTIIEPNEFLKIDKWPEPLTAGGSAQLLDGVREGIKHSQDRKQFYKRVGLNYDPPLILLITNSRVDSGEKEKGLTEELLKGEGQGDFIFTWIDGKGGIIPMLKGLSHAYDGYKIKGKDLSELLHQAMPSIVTNPGSSSKKIKLPEPIWIQDTRL